MNWITFKLENVYRHLIEKGKVYTVRPLSVHPKTTRNVRSPEHQITYRAIIKTCRPLLDLESLKDFVGESGFSSLEDWIKAIHKFYGNPPRKDLYLWEVVLKGRRKVRRR